jgi:hypothetical protein
MNTIYKHEQGFAHIAAIGLVIVALGIGGTGYYVYHKNHGTKAAPAAVQTSPSTDTSSQSKNNADNFAAAQDIYDFIGNSIKNSGLDIGYTQGTIRNNPTAYAVYPSTTTGGKVKLLSLTDYFLSKPCGSDCSSIRDENGALKSEFYPTNTTNLIGKIKDSLVGHAGVGAIKSGSEPGTYVLHDYFIAAVTLSDSSKVTLQVSFEGGDAGPYVSASIY